MKITLRTVALCSALAFTLAHPSFSQAFASGSALSAEEDPAYAAGTKAMNESRWSDAVQSFDQVVRARGKKADGALYWKAYSLNKLGKTQLAADTCTQLYKQYRGSTWNKDCQELALTALKGQTNEPQWPKPTPMPGSTGPGVKDPDADLKILAINSLMNRDPAQAVPLLRNLLTSDQPKEVQRQALFVLSQSPSPHAAALMHDAVLGKLGLSVQRQAIQAVGIFQGRRSNDMLAEVYTSTTDPEVKRAVINAFFISADDVRLVALARSEKDREMKREVVSKLALMQTKAATDYMLELLK